jgi:hypothetical protein
MAMRRESNERMADFAVADVSLFWLLNALNSAEPVLAQFQRYPQSPERLYPELARLAGSLLTFSLEHQVSAIPVYQHEQLNAVFPPLFDLLSDLLEASLPSRVVAIELSMMPGCTSGRLVCMIRACGKGLITTCPYASGSGGTAAGAVPASAKWAALIMSQVSSILPTGRPAHAIASCAGSHSAASGKPVFQPRCLPSWRTKCWRAAPVCFTSRACSASLNLNSLRY